MHYLFSQYICIQYSHDTSAFPILELYICKHTFNINFNFLFIQYISYSHSRYICKTLTLLKLPVYIYVFKCLSVSPDVITCRSFLSLVFHVFPVYLTSLLPRSSGPNPIFFSLVGWYLDFVEALGSPFLKCVVSICALPK